MISRGPDSGIYAMLRQAMLNNCKEKGKKLGRIPVLAYSLTRQNNTQRIFLDSGFRRNDGFGVFNGRSNIKQYMGIAGTDVGQYG